ncbi:transposase [Streptomyces sp. JV176]|uniref:transposase n=1 Tax=Streptomyces sp. JV176 TaxID=858630 RepID=UPI003FA7C29E
MAGFRHGRAEVLQQVPAVGDLRSYPRRRGIAHTIPERADQIPGRPGRGTRGGRPPGFDRRVHRRRNVVEHRFNRLKQRRGLATRHDKTRESYQAAITNASITLRT